VILDEIHRLPGIFKTLRTLLIEDAAKGIVVGISAPRFCFD